MMRGDDREALKVFEEALRKEPALPALRFNRAVVLLKVGETARASAELRKIAADPASPMRALAAYHNALALDRLGKLAEAEAALQQATALDPALDAARLYAGSVRERLGDVNGAARAYLDYLKRNPDSLQAMLHLGIAAQRAGRGDVARTYLRKVIERAPDSVEAVEARKFLVMWD